MFASHVKVQSVSLKKPNLGCLEEWHCLWDFFRWIWDLFLFFKKKLSSVLNDEVERESRWRTHKRVLDVWFIYLVYFNEFWRYLTVKKIKFDFEINFDSFWAITHCIIKYYLMDTSSFSWWKIFKIKLFKYQEICAKKNLIGIKHKIWLYIRDKKYI